MTWFTNVQSAGDGYRDGHQVDRAEVGRTGVDGRAGGHNMELAGAA